MRRFVAAAADRYLVQPSGFSTCAFCSCDAQNVCSYLALDAPVPVNPVTFGFPANNMVEVNF